MNKKSYILIILFIASLFAAIFFVTKKSLKSVDNAKQEVNSINSVEIPQQEPSIINQEIQNQKNTANPINNALGRITKKPFGIFITPKTSPVQPERFSGYHTGVDLETNSSEQDIDVSVKALCDGKLLAARFASGYGGVVVQSCTLDGQEVTVIYGHLNLASVKSKIGEEILAGDFLANLGKGYSSQTDGERKHLHLAIHKGTVINILGYVQNKNQLVDWIDPKIFL
jgi:murein DD-endopeptidase MepM/ murein hydrolase activator NlpD